MVCLVSSVAIFFSSFNTVSNIPLLHSNPEKVAFQGILILLPQGKSPGVAAAGQLLTLNSCPRDNELEKIPILGQPGCCSKDHGMESLFFFLTAVGVFLVHHAHVSLAQRC